ncbi:MAG: hypothetical protein J6386_14895 [Candidatus Synoicihabitans palmerolidicus]|nr:hypothetical protein [Candidatus Synoicihabitans palmerolidicus]
MPVNPASGAESEDDEDAWYNRDASRGSDHGVLLRLFILGVKLIPVALLLGAGYYAYQTFFGPISDAAREAYLRSPTAGAAGGAETVPYSRAGLLIQQTKDSVAAHDKNVLSANSIAENAEDFDKIASSIEQSILPPATASAPAAPPEPEPKVQLDLAGARRAQAVVNAPQQPTIQVRPPEGPARMALS